MPECCWYVGVPLSSVCVVKLRKLSPHHPISQTFLSCSPVFPLWNFPMSFLSLFTSYFFEKSLILSLSVSSPLHLYAHDSPVLSLSFPPPPLHLPWRHLRSISVFSPSSMWLQPFSHSTSNQTYSAYWWSSKGPQVDFYLSLHEALPLYLHLPTHHPLSSSPQTLSLSGNLSLGCWTHGTDTMACVISLSVSIDCKVLALHEGHYINL